MCTWGMVATDSEGEGLVKKETYWVTNSRFIAAELDRECTNKTGERPWHRHVHLTNHKAHAHEFIHLRLSQQSSGDSGNNSGA